MKNMKIKAKIKNGIANAKVLVKHEMLTYDQAKKKGVEANFITHMSAKVNNKVVFDISTSQFLSKDPQFKFSFKGASKGDLIEITWVDLSGNTITESKKIK